MDEYLGSTGGERVTLRLTPDLRRVIEEYGGPAGMSEAARRLMVIGLETVQERRERPAFTRLGSQDRDHD